MTNKNPLPGDDLDFIDPDEELSPEDKFYAELTTDTMPKLANTRIWLADHIYNYVSICRNSPMRLMLGKKEVSLTQFARETLRHYFLMHYHPRFYNQVDGLARLNMDKVLDLVMEYGPIIKTILEAKIELDRP